MGGLFLSDALTIVCNRPLEPFDRQELKLAQVCDSHQTQGFRAQELLERQSQPSGNLCRNIFNLPQRDLFESGSPYGFNCQIQPPQSFTRSQIKFLGRLNLERVASLDRPHQTGMGAFLDLF